MVPPVLLLRAASSPLLASLASPSEPTEMNLAGDCTDVSPCSVQPFPPHSSSYPPLLPASPFPHFRQAPPALEWPSTTTPPLPLPPCPFLCSCPSPRYLELCCGSSSLVLLSPPPAAIPLPAPLLYFFSADRSGGSQGLSQHGNRGAWPHKTRGEPQPLTHWHLRDAAPSPPSLWAVVWEQGEEVAVTVCSGVSSMATNTTSWGSPNPALAAQSQLWLRDK